MFFYKQLSVAPLSRNAFSFNLMIQGVPVSGSLFCPFVEKTSPFFVEVQGFGTSWAIDHGLVVEGSLLCQAVEHASFDTLCAYSCPDVGMEDLRLAIKWRVWTFVMEASSFERLEMLDRDTLVQQHARFEAVLSGDANADDGSSLVRGLKDIYADLSEKKSSLSQFRNAVKRYLGYHAWCVENKFKDKVPMSTVCRVLQQNSGINRTVLTLGFLMKGLDLPKALCEDSVFDSMLEFAAFTMDSVKDIFAADSMLKCGQKENWVILIASEKNSTFSAAIREACEQNERDLAGYNGLKKTLRTFQSHPAIGSLENAMLGQLRWALETQQGTVL